MTDTNTALTNALVGVLVLVIPIVGGMLAAALRKLRAKWGLEGVAQNSWNMENDLRAALNVGITKMLPDIKTLGWNSVTVQNAILEIAKAYLAQRFPDRAAQIVAAADPAIGPTNALKETLAARLPEAIKIAADSPATPPIKSPDGASP